MHSPIDCFASNGEVKIHYVVQGDGPLVVLLHGNADYWGSWKSLMATLDEAGYCAAAMDLRGYNLSDQPKGVDAYRFPHLINDVAAVIAAEGQTKAIVVGHDWGAAIAWQVAIQRPDLVDKLVTMSVPNPQGWYRALANDPAQIETARYVDRFQQPGSEKDLSAQVLADRITDPIERQGYLEAFERSDFEGWMNFYRANFPSERGADLALPNPPKIGVSTLIIHGMDDKVVTASGHSGTWDEVTEDSTILVIPKAAHAVHREASTLVNRTVRDWLLQRR